MTQRAPRDGGSGTLPMLVVCALEFERRALARAGLGRRVDLACCGPGPRSVGAWTERCAPVDRPVILAGLAGGLARERPAGGAWIVTEVRASDGTTWTPPLHAQADEPCRVTSTAEVAATPEAKRALGERTGADLVDLESCAFAHAAARAGWTWGIVRGVGDDWKTPLPPDVVTWVDDHGHTHPGRVARTLLRHPTLIAPLSRLRRTTTTAMHAVAARLEELL